MGMLAEVVRGRSERSDCARRGTFAASPLRKKSGKRCESRDRPPRPLRDGKGQGGEKMGIGVDRQGRPPRPKKSKRKNSREESGERNDEMKMKDRKLNVE